MTAVIIKFNFIFCRPNRVGLQGKRQRPACSIRLSKCNKSNSIICKYVQYPTVESN